MRHGDAIAGSVDGVLRLSLTIILMVAEAISRMLSERSRGRHVDSLEWQLVKYASSLGGSILRKTNIYCKGGGKVIESALIRELQ
jgi:hypothetical protein